MNAKSIVRAGDPVLRQIAQPVDDPTAPDVRTLIDDMTASLAEAGGIGLAAPQIGILRRVILISVPAARAQDDPDDGPLELTALINPTLEPVEETRVLRWEGCLSLPGLRGAVPRWHRVRMRGLSPEGEPVEAVYAGMRAGVLQHEIDHLDGILYVDRMTDFTQFGFAEEVLRAQVAAFDQASASQTRDERHAP